MSDPRETPEFARISCPCGAELEVPLRGGRVRCACGLVHDPPQDGWFDPVPGPVRRGDWGGCGPPASAGRSVDVRWGYSPEDLERIRWGFKPRSMDEKWFVYAEGDSLFFHRSWTGLFCYRADLDAEGVARVFVSDGLESRDADEHLRLIRWIVDHLLVGRDPGEP